MSGFSSAWLALREPADRAARSMPLTTEVSRRLAQAWPGVSSREPLKVLDLATGTGANPRYLSEHLLPYQEWTLVDSDQQLLSALRVRMAAWATRAGWATVQSRTGMVVASESSELRLLPQRCDIAVFPIAGLAEQPMLVTASALLDLVSEPWLQHLVDATCATHAPVIFALTYDGRTALTPAHGADELILDCVNRHQQTEKGFGPALGPAAVSTAATLFDRAGYLVLRARSDWLLAADQRRLQDELIAGWADAACAIEPAAQAEIRAWERTRRSDAADGRLEIMVGHEDLAAWPR